MVICCIYYRQWSDDRLKDTFLVQCASWCSSLDEVFQVGWDRLGRHWDSCVACYYHTMIVHKQDVKIRYDIFCSWFTHALWSIEKMSEQLINADLIVIKCKINWMNSKASIHFNWCWSFHLTHIASMFSTCINKLIFSKLTFWCGS